jgi:ectoine hydroxylase-related dioxygenase (phytanoyl-CoA dioxygenase family)
MSPPNFQLDVERDGFSIVPQCFNTDEMACLIDWVEPLFAEMGRTKGGIRDVFSRCPALRDWCQQSTIWNRIDPILCSSRVIVNATLFDKAEGRNWKVPFHQDVTIRVKERKTVDGFDTWWEKDGVPHVWPTARVLENMLAVRIHLDDCGIENGPLRVIPKSHTSGILSAEEIERWRLDHPELTCPAAAGDMILIRPLLLHASSTATLPQRRRVLHLEFGSGELPGGLEWYDAVSPIH